MGLLKRQACLAEVYKCSSGVDENQGEWKEKEKKGRVKKEYGGRGKVVWRKFFNSESFTHQFIVLLVV